jgi:hypothetical protein
MSFVPYAGGNFSSLDVTAASVVKATPGVLVTITVLVAGAAGAAYDSTSTSGNTAADQICVIPAAVGIYALNWPCFNGIVIAPGASQVVSVAYS